MRALRVLVGATRPAEIAALDQHRPLAHIPPAQRRAPPADARPSRPAPRSGSRRDGACTEYPAARRCRHAACALRPEADSETRADGGFNAAARIASTVAGANGRTSSRCGWRAFRTDQHWVSRDVLGLTGRLKNRAEQHQRLDDTARAGTLRSRSACQRAIACGVRSPARTRLETGQCGSHTAPYRCASCSRPVAPHTREPTSPTRSYQA